MSTAVSPAPRSNSRHRVAAGRDWQRSLDRFGDGLLFGVCALAALLAAAILILVGYQVVHGASPAISKFGLGFIFHTTWQPNPPFEDFGAGSVLFGTVVSSFFALFLGAPIAISIGLYLSLLAPKGVRGVISPLVEMLAAIPSVILGFWGILVLAPFVARTRRAVPARHARLHPALRPAPDDRVQRLHREPDPDDHDHPDHRLDLARPLPLGPPGVQDGASALGATRWEVVRGVVLPSTASGVVAASLLGLGRALGEAIAVTQVIGAGSEINASLFETGDTLAAADRQPVPRRDHPAAPGIALLPRRHPAGDRAGLEPLAQWIGRRFDVREGGLAR